MVSSKIESLDQLNGHKRKSSKINIKEQIKSYLFMLPAVISLSLFVFIPLLFSFLISIYNNPTPLELKNAIDYYTNFSNLSLVSLNRFFYWNFEDYQGIFLIDGIYLITSILLMIGYIRLIWKKLKIKSRYSPVARGFFALFLGIITVPLTLAFFQWFMTTVTIISGNIRLPIDEYRRVLTAPEIDFIRVLFNTLFWTFSSTFLHIVLGIFLATLLNRKFHGRSFFRGVFILPWAIPSFVSTLIWRALVYDPKTGILGNTTSELGTSFAFTWGTILAYLLIFIIAIFCIFIVNHFVIQNKKNKRLQTILLLFLFTIALIISIYFGNFIADWFNSMDISLFNTKIIDIPSISPTFWYTDDIYLFGIKFKMITFSAIFVNTWLGVPFMMVSFLAALQTIPKDLYEAAQIDGASKWYQFKKITLPSLKPTLFTVSLLGTIWTFNLFNVVYLLTQNQTGLGNAIYYDIFVTFIYNRFSDSYFAEAAALSFTVFLILIVFSIIYKRSLKEEKS